MADPAENPGKIFVRIAALALIALSETSPDSTDPKHQSCCGDVVSNGGAYHSYSVPGSLLRRTLLRRAWAHTPNCWPKVWARSKPTKL